MRKTQSSLWRRAFGFGTALAFAVGTTVFVGCSDDDDPTNPNNGDDPGLALTGDGAATLPFPNFQASSSTVTAEGSYQWVDDGTVPLRTQLGGGDVTLLVTPDSPTSSTASSVGLTYQGTTWAEISGGLGVAGITISTTTVDFEEVELPEIGGTTMVVLNGFLNIPTVSVPSAPTGVAADGVDNGVFVSWGSVAGATSYNVYWASETGVTPANYTTLENGGAAIGVTSPHTFTATPGLTYYAVVTAENSAGESAPSDEVSAEPTDPNAPFGTLAVGGDGAGGLASTTFAPISSWPGNNAQAVYLWADPNETQTVLAVTYDRGADHIDAIYVYSDLETWGVSNPDNGVAGAMVSGSTFVFTDAQLTSSTTTLTLDGTLGRGTVVFPGGTLIFNGDDVGTLLTSPFAPDGINVVAGSAVLEFEDSTTGVTVSVDIGNTLEGVNSVVVSKGTDSWGTDPFGFPPVLLDGNAISHTNVLCDDLGGGAKNSITVNGSLLW